MHRVSLMNANILVVDDDDDMRNGLVELLDAEGFLVDSAANGRLALDRIRREKPDVILTDITMPELDGFALCREVHAIDPLLPVIVITGHSEMSFALRAMRSGAVDYLVKPVDSDTVFSSVRRALETRAMKAELQQHDLPLHVILSGLKILGDELAAPEAGASAPDAKRRKACASTVAGPEKA